MRGRLTPTGESPRLDRGTFLVQAWPWNAASRSYSCWVKPAYYVITDGDGLAVWNYQGGAVPDVRVIEASSRHA